MKRIVLIATLALCLSRLAAAQEAAPPLQEDPSAAKFKDVERGFFVGFEAGYLGFVETPTEDEAKYPYAGSSGGRAGGMLVAAEVGYDLSSRLSLSLFAEGGNARARVSYGAFASTPAASTSATPTSGGRTGTTGSGSSSTFTPAAAMRSPIRRGCSGRATWCAAGPGVEYFTQLRHFSVGASLDYVRAFKAKAHGFALYPTVRYTF